MTAEATTITDVQKNIDKINQQIDKLNQNVENMEEKQEILEEEMEDLNAEIVNTMTSIGMKEDEIGETEVALTHKEADIEVTAGEYEKAKEVYNEVLEYSPEYSWAYFNLAQIAWVEKDIETAIRNLIKTLEINPKDIEASKLLTQIYIKERDYENAQNVINQALEQNPYLGDFYYFLSKTTPNDKSFQKENLKKALENYKTLTISSKQIKLELKKNK